MVSKTAVNTAIGVVLGVIAAEFILKNTPVGDLVG